MADWISIVVDLLIGGGFAFILSSVVPRKLNDDRCLKDFFITELQQIKEEVNALCGKICLNEISASALKESLKQYSLKLNNIQYVVNREMDIEINPLQGLNSIQLFITNSLEMNEQYSEDVVVFEPSTIKVLREKQSVFNLNMISSIAWVNKANSKRR